MEMLCDRNQIVTRQIVDAVIAEVFELLSFIEESQIISREPLSTRGSLIF